ncbi:MAG: hypothetical protein NTW96_04265 [Planctomycetia bacterium]|nr:hypothetical protein [Planctomycetia bacterium]
MRLRDLAAFLLVVISFAGVFDANRSAARAGAAEPARDDSRPRLWRRIALGDYGSTYARIGDLDGDGRPDVLFVQVYCTDGNENRAVLSCLTAIDLDGKILWQVGKPDISHIYFGGDFPVQIYDRDRDGYNEVIYIPDEKNVLTILDGRTGKVTKEVQLAGGHDSILFADFSATGYAQDTLIKDRYSSFWVYDKDFKLLWSKIDCNPGHYPMEYDFDGDGRDELLCGFALYGHDGKVRWNKDFPGHNDAVYVADMDGDGRPEIAIAASDGTPGPQTILLDADGNVLWRKQADHSQHALIGDFRPDLPGKEVCFIDRQMNHEPVRSELTLFTKSGEQLLTNRENIWYMAGEVIDHWTARPGENLIGLYSRGFAPPCLMDGHGREIATFPLPEAIKEKGGGPDGKDLYDDYYVQHMDFVGDDREEIFCCNHQAIYIWTNDAPVDKPVIPQRPKSPLPQPPRLRNNNFYPGRL